MDPQFWATHKIELLYKGNVIDEKYIPITRPVTYESFLQEQRWKKKYKKHSSSLETKLVSFDNPILIQRSFKTKKNG